MKQSKRMCATFHQAHAPWSENAIVKGKPFLVTKGHPHIVVARAVIIRNPWDTPWGGVAGISRRQLQRGYRWTPYSTIKVIPVRDIMRW